MKLLILALFILGPSSIGFGQLISPCELGQNAAAFTLATGEVYFPRLTVKSSFTLRKMLEIEYEIKDEIYDNGTDISFSGEAECFFKVMKSEIEKRWGKDFLRKQRRIANSLDNEGIGYIEPEENGIADTLSHYLRKEHLLDLVDKNYLVSIKITGDKDIIDVGVLSGLPHATEISRDLDDYLFIKEAIFKVVKVYEPGRLRGKPVESTLMFWIEL